MSKLEIAALARIRLIVADIDGCLSRGSTTYFSPELIRRLVEANRLSRENEDIPAITYCTGRPQPYVECLIQATHGYMPALCEGGTVFYDPTTHSLFTHPNFGTREEKLLGELHGHVGRKLISEHVKHEPGKVTHITLLVESPYKPDDFLPQALEIAALYPEDIVVETTRACIHFMFRHLHKGTGIQWLSDRTGIAPESMAGIGDSRPDLPFLKMMGLACAPSNAHADVKDLCGYISEKPDALAAIDFLEHIVEHNRSLSR